LGIYFDHNDINYLFEYYDFSLYGLYLQKYGIAYDKQELYNYIDNFDEYDNNINESIKILKKT
jgi:hypothetical protein